MYMSKQFWLSLSLPFLSQGDEKWIPFNLSLYLSVSPGFSFPVHSHLWYQHEICFSPLAYLLDLEMISEMYRSVSLVSHGEGCIGQSKVINLSRHPALPSREIIFPYFIRRRHAVSHGQGGLAQGAQRRNQLFNHNYKSNGYWIISPLHHFSMLLWGPAQNPERLDEAISDL